MRTLCLFNMVFATLLWFEMVWMIIVNGNWCISQTILCHSGIKTRALLFSSCNPVRLVLGVSFRTDSMAFNIDLIPSNYHIDSTGVISLFPTLMTSFFFFHLNRYDKGGGVSFLSPTRTYKSSNNITCIRLWEEIVIFFYIALSLFSCHGARQEPMVEW